MTATLSASPVKLTSGAWGALVRSNSVRVGSIVRVTTKAGKSWDAKVTSLIRTNADGSTVCETASIGASPSTSYRVGAARPGGRIHCDECGEYVARGSRCWETGAQH